MGGRVRVVDPSVSSGDALKGEAKRRYVGDLFVRIAPRYDLMNTLMTGGMHHRWRKLAAGVATGGPEGMALDIATGTGDLVFALARGKGHPDRGGPGPALGNGRSRPGQSSFEEA